MKNNIKKVIVALKRKGFFSFIPDRTFYEITYRIHCKGKINWKDPKTYSEKLNWLKLYDRNEDIKRLVDKVEVRKYIQEKIGEEYLIPCYGIYESFDEIDFSELPDVFVMKCSHDSGSVKIVDKNKSDYSVLKQYYDSRIKIDYFHYSAREWCYKGLKPRIIVEKFIKEDDSSELRNYKFHCFDGHPKFMQIEIGGGQPRCMGRLL